MGGPTSIDRQFGKVVAVFGAGADTSSAVNLGGHVIASIFFPAGWTPQDLTFEASPDDGATWYPVVGDDGNAVTVLGASQGASECMVNKAILEQLAGLTWIRLKSAVAQAGGDSVVLLLKG